LSWEEGGSYAGLYNCSIAAWLHDWMAGCTSTLLTI